MSSLGNQIPPPSMSLSEMQFAMKGAAGNAPVAHNMAAGGDHHGLGDSASYANKFPQTIEFKDHATVSGGNIDNVLRTQSVDAASFKLLQPAFETDLGSLFQNAGFAKLATEGMFEITPDNLGAASMNLGGAQITAFRDGPAQGLIGKSTLR